MKSLFVVAFALFFICPGCKSAPTQQKQDTNENETTITGDFRSIQGVMDELSCYCFNGGYVTLESGEETAVCFDKDAEVKGCNQIKLSGILEEKTINPEKTSPCTAGDMTILEVTAYECLE